VLQYSHHGEEFGLLKVTGTRYILDKVEGKIVFALDEFNHRAAPESEFTLSAYGFEEPETPDVMKNRPTATRWWLWGALAGGALLVLGAIFSWLHQRTKR
jgi:hypothetical protein